ncbi:MAG: superoxide dismutase, Ni, partial [Candidatus Aenigmarchaeota archaeon]|nr:superoxide dismutase, Ni [Candidatus Aenigmarchaeota archaeon]
CDIPCGIYDPHNAQMAAHTVVRMVQLMDEATRAMGETPTKEQRLKFVHDFARYTHVKEEHTEIVKREVRVLWGDYFKPDNVTTETHELVWKIMKSASKARQGYDMKDAEELLDTVNRLAEIFWKTKNMPTVRVKAPYPTGKEIVVPKT